jgi:hypothetical protein
MSDIKVQTFTQGRALREQAEGNAILEELNDALAKIGLPIPERPPKQSKFDWPLDISQCTTAHVRGLMSYYQAQVGYALAVLGRLGYVIGLLEGQVEPLRRRLKGRYMGRGVRQAEALGRIEKNKKIRQLEEDLEKAKRLRDMVRGMQEAYQGYADKASRDLTVREAEFRARH